MSVRRRIIRPHQQELTRTFPPGTALFVRQGQHVTPEEYVAQTTDPAGFRVVPVARALGVDGRHVPQHLVKPIGSRIYRGEVLVKRSSLFGLARYQVSSPSDGVIESVTGTGDVVIRYPSRKSRVNAEFWGKVTSVSGATVKLMTQVATISGVAGYGHVRGGMLEVLPNPALFILPKDIEPAMGGRIIVGGRIPSDATLKKAIVMQVAGFVLGGIHARFWVQNKAQMAWQDSGIALMLTEGFGQIPLGQDLFSFIKAYNGRYAVLNAHTHILSIPIQPDEQVTEQSSTAPQLASGTHVRIIAGVHLGRQGVVREFPPTLTQLRSGLTAETIGVDVDGTMVRIPRANIEILW